MPSQESNYFAFLKRTFNSRWCAWHMATAKASAASSTTPLGMVGKSKATIKATWCFSACPDPTTYFFTLFAEYSATFNPNDAGVNKTTPRAMPSFKADAGFWFTKVSSTAAS